MFNFIWPIALVVLSNVVYQICAKSVPDKLSPFASLTITYIVGAAVSCLFYFIFNRQGNITKEFTKANWAPFVLGLVIVGLEVGYIYAYKAGWQISIAPIVQSAFLAVILVFVGFLFYKEAITWNKIAGIAICIAGLVVINIK